MQTAGGGVKGTLFGRMWGEVVRVVGIPQGVKVKYVCFVPFFYEME